MQTTTPLLWGQGEGLGTGLPGRDREGVDEVKETWLLQPMSPCNCHFCVHLLCAKAAVVVSKGCVGQAGIMSCGFKPSLYLSNILSFFSV